MASTVGQSTWTEGRPRSAGTRQRLLAAAVDLIASEGWGRVTTRRVADRAGLPHGAVSYHFHSKENLLTTAVLDAVERMFPVDRFRQAGSVAELVTAVKAALGEVAGSGGAAGPAPAAVLMEAIRESGRNPALRERLAGLLRRYREAVADLLGVQQRRGDLPAGSPAGIATLLLAAGDGLMLHAMLDPTLDAAGAAETLFALLGAEAPGGRDHPPPL